jgi:carboxyl-terminal processing protease
MKKSLLILIVCLLFGGISFSQTANDKTATNNDPGKIFDYLWKVYDVNYGIFTAKHIDWKALYNVYRPQITSKTTDDELFKIVSKLISHLNDNHVRMFSEKPDRFYGAGFLYDFYGGSWADFRKSMRIRPPVNKYLETPLKFTGNNVFAYGWLPGKIGYFHFNGFGNSDISAKAIDEIIEEFKDAKAIIADVRKNGGGDDQVGKLIAGRFADTKRLYMTTQQRNGLNHTDFEPKKYWFVEPEGPIQFTKTVILITDRTSISAAENFTLAMRVLPHVTVIGDFTSGCFGDVYNFRTPNGWNLSLAMNLFLDYTGFCWEGIGVRPDIKIHQNYFQDSTANDTTLETGIALIKSGNLALQDESESLKQTKSLTKILEQNIESEGIENALKKFNEINKSGDENYYVDYRDLLTLYSKLTEKGKTKEGEQVFSLLNILFPDPSFAYDEAAHLFAKQKNTGKAIEMLKKAILIYEKKAVPESIQYSDYLGDMMIMTLLADGYKEMHKKYSALKEKYPAQVNESFINNLGYRLLNNNFIDYSIELFKLNTEEYPASSNVYDSLGEAYMMAGNKEQAIINYERAAKMDPNNKTAPAALEKLKN